MPSNAFPPNPSLLSRLYAAWLALWDLSGEAARDYGGELRLLEAQCLSLQREVGRLRGLVANLHELTKP